MGIKFHKYARIFPGVMLFAACLGPAWAKDKTEILTISPVPMLAPDGAAVPGNVGGGKIDEIQKKGVIIGDSYHPFSSSVIFLSAKRKSISRSGFEVGKKVGYRLNSKDEIVVIWIEDGAKAP